MNEIVFKEIVEKLLSIYNGEEKEFDINKSIDRVNAYNDLTKDNIVNIKKAFYKRIDEIEYRRQENNVYSTIALKEAIIYRNKPVQAYISNISVPTSLEEMLEYFIEGNDAQMLVDEIDNGNYKTNWTVPRWVKRGDIVLFMHAKTANSTLTALRTELRKTNKYKQNEKNKLEKAIASQLAFHKQYGGCIFAIGRINGIPEYDEGPKGILHWGSRLYCDIDNLFLLENPINISQFNSFININRMSSITPIYNEEYNRLKNMIMESNHVLPYFQYSYSTPIPSVRINKENWIKLGIEYRRSFTLEEQFRSCYVNYLLALLGDQKKIFKECRCYKGNDPVTFIDNIIKFDNKWLPVEVKLNIEAEADLPDQCNQYCKLDKLVIDKEGRVVEIKDVISDKVLVIDTYAVYIYNNNDNTIKFIYDLDDLKDFEDIKEIKERVREGLNK